jgi:hypothetical protein
MDCHNRTNGGRPLSGRFRSKADVRSAARAIKNENSLRIAILVEFETQYATKRICTSFELTGTLITALR